MYLFEKDEDSIVQQALLVSINLHSNVSTSFYSNIMELSESYNLPDFVPNNLEKTKISRFITQKKRVLWLVNYPFPICPWVNNDESQRVQSRTRHFLRGHSIFSLRLQRFCLDTERKFKNVKGFVIHIETEDSIQQNGFLKEKNLYTALNDLRAPIARTDDNTHVIPLLSFSKIKSFSLLIVS